MGPRVEIKPEAIRLAAQEILRRVGVPVFAVVKANAYGLGTIDAAGCVSDLVAGFCVFSLEEAAAVELWKLGKPILALGPPSKNATAADYRDARVRPAVSNVEQARALRDARPLVCVDTGMRRFGCLPEQFGAVVEAAGANEAYTHATQVEHALELEKLAAGRDLFLHAAGSSLLAEPRAHLNAIRPGLALYRSAVRITAPIVELHEGPAPAGYTRFESPRHGIILAGYRHGLRPGPCLVNGRRQRVLEVGMQTSYVSLSPQDRVNDPVTLLGDSLLPDNLATAWNCTPQEVLVSLLRKI